MKSYPSHQREIGRKVEREARLVRRAQRPCSQACGSGAFRFRALHCRRRVRARLRSQGWPGIGNPSGVGRVSEPAPTARELAGRAELLVRQAEHALAATDDPGLQWFARNVVGVIIAEVDRAISRIGALATAIQGLGGTCRPPRSQPGAPKWSVSSSTS